MPWTVICAVTDILSKTVREYVGRYRLDELLEQKEEIGRFVLDKLKEYQEEYCVEITGAGIKDIILP